MAMHWSNSTVHGNIFQFEFRSVIDTSQRCVNSVDVHSIRYSFFNWNDKLSKMLNDYLAVWNVALNFMHTEGIQSILFSSNKHWILFAPIRNSVQVESTFTLSLIKVRIETRLSTISKFLGYFSRLQLSSETDGIFLVNNWKWVREE